MSPGFCRFRDLLQPYEKYVNEQKKALDYLRSLSANTDFMTYLTWCHGHKSCNRYVKNYPQSECKAKSNIFSKILAKETS